MKREKQTLTEILSVLSPLETSWEDPISQKATEKLTAWPSKKIYSLSDVEALLEDDFKTGILCVRLFLGISDDEMTTQLTNILGPGGIGVTRFSTNRIQFLDALSKMNILEAMCSIVNREVKWSDVLVERLRSGRGKAIRGQRRGRKLEDFVENILKDVFGAGKYQSRCQFIGANGKEAKCDFAIPTKGDASILIEAKGYGATGSKMTDVLGDLNSIIEQKRHDTTLIFFTDGTTWAQRQADLEKIIALQNSGKIFRIYTTQMAETFKQDLKALKEEHRL